MVSSIEAKVYAVEEREEQIALAFLEIQKMVDEGIAAEDIVLILPDESFKEHFMLFDKQNNLNFAMGYDYSRGRVYKSLDAIYNYWQSYDKESYFLLERYGLDVEKIEAISSSEIVDVESFFTSLKSLKLLDAPVEDGSRYNERAYEEHIYFLKIFEGVSLSMKEWLFLWLKLLSKITIDDVRGGLVTVMGVLETRGVSFEGVVIVDFNEGIVPARSSKDQFLNSSVRLFADLPTKYDRESLQKQYYKRLLEKSNKAVIIYSNSDNKLPSGFLYELGLKNIKQLQVPHNVLYREQSCLVKEGDPLVGEFDAHNFVWSASRLKSYLSCKRQFYYKYIQKIKAKVTIP